MGYHPFPTGSGVISLKMMGAPIGAGEGASMLENSVRIAAPLDSDSVETGEFGSLVIDIAGRRWVLR